MPYLKIQTNVTIETDSRRELLSAVSGLISKELGKPEQYVAVVLEPGLDFIFGGTDAPAAFLQLKSLGFPVKKAGRLSEVLCQLLHTQLQIDPERIYIEMSDHPASHWGWNGSTF